MKTQLLAGWRKAGGIPRKAGWFGALVLLTLLGLVAFTPPIRPVPTPTATRATGGFMRITEYMYSGTPGEFFELTNVGDTPVSLVGWSIDDQSQYHGSVSLSGLGTVLPGESVVVTEASASAFRTAWKLASFVKVLGGNNQNLDRSDEINLYDAANNLVDRLTFNDQTMPGTIRTQGVSGWTTLAKLGTNTVANWRLSAVSDRQNSVTATSGNIGSPGTYTYGGEEAAFIEVDGSATTWQLRAPGSGPAFISGAIGDPTDPASVSGIAFALDDPTPPFNNVTVTASSSNPAVVPNSNLVLTGGGTWYNLKITPAGVGYTTITVLARRGPETDTYLINYAASAASQATATTRHYTGTGDGSTALGIDASYMLVGDDENQTIRLFHRTKSGLPFSSFDFSSVLNLTDGKEVDIEGSIRTGNRIYWIGSQSNNEDGEARPSRNRLFATTVNSTGNTTYLSYLGRYDYLREDLIAWDVNNRHGKGASYYGFAASAAPGVNSKQAAGYNIEGLELAPDNTTGYVCFRAPLVPVPNRNRALVVPVSNFTTLTGSQPQGTATFGAPIELDLGGRGIREMRKNPTNTYVIVAGPPGDATGVAPADFRLYTWDGNPNTAPVLRDTDLTGLNVPGSFESIVEVPIQLTSTTPIQFLMDNGITTFYNDGTPTKDLGIVPFKKFRSELIPLGGQATPPPIVWQKTLGGTGSDGASAITATDDGGYVVAGTTTSNNGDVSGNHGGSDAWVVRVNSAGTIVWQKALGGTGEDQVLAITKLTDGGFVVAGITYSNDGDVSGNHGASDLWVVKLNSTGNIVWQKALGGSDVEWGFGITATTDGGIVAVGREQSNDGDVTGNHGGLFSSDFWVVRLNNAGHLVWQKTLGGTRIDEAFAVTALSDGGFAVTGFTRSSNGDVTGLHGTDFTDIWVVKLDVSGNLVWQKALGGSRDEFARTITATADGGLVVAGRAQSNNGDVSGLHDEDDKDDIWVVKLTGTGTIVWQKPLGGNAVDEAFAITATDDGGYVVAGLTESNDGDVSGNHGRSDVWVVKLNGAGKLIWQKTYGGTGYDAGRAMVPTADGGYLVAGSTTSNNGDVSGNHGDSDVWVIKLGYPAPTPLQTEKLALLAPLFDCQTRTLAFRSTGGDGSPIEFSAIGVTDWATNPSQTVEAGVVADKNSAPLTLRARQNNQTVTYDFDLHAVCSGLGTGLALLTPSFDCLTGAITFRTSGGNGSPIEFFAVGVTGWTTNPNQTVEAGVLADKNTRSLLLMARQSGQVVSYPFDFRDQCPVSLTAYLGRQVSQTPGWGFLDRESDVLVEATGLPPGIRLDLVQVDLPDIRGLYWVFSGAPASTSGSPYRVIVTRRYKFAPGKVTQTIYLVTVLPSPLMFLPPAYDCATGALTIRYGDGNFTAVDKMVPGLAGWQSSPSFTVPSWIRSDPNAQPLRLMLRQSGQVFTYLFNFHAQCGTTRFATPETDTNLQITLLGNPVSGEIVAEVTGAAGQSLQTRLTDVGGRVLAKQQLDSAQATEQIRIPLTQRPAGMLLLIVSTPTRHRTIRVLLHP